MDRFKKGFVNQTRLLFLSRRFLAMLIVLVVMSLVAMQAYHMKVVRNLPVAIVDFDNSKISRTIRSFIDATPEAEVVDLAIDNVEHAKQLLIQGRVNAIVLLPADLSVKIKKGQRAQTLVWIDSASILIGKNLYKAIYKPIKTVAAGVQLTVVKKQGVQKDKAMAKVLPVTINENYNFNPSTNYSVYVIPGMIFFFFHVYLIIISGSLFVPKWRPPNLAEWIGAYGANWLWGILIGLVFTYMLLPIEDIWPESGFFIVLVNLALFVLADIFMAVAFCLLIPESMLGLESAIVIGMLSMFFAGITWPTDMFPTAIRIFSEFVPFTPYARGVRMIFHYPMHFAEIWPLFMKYLMQYATFAALGFAGYVLQTKIPWLKKIADEERELSREYHESC